MHENFLNQIFLMTYPKNTFHLAGFPDVRVDLPSWTFPDVRVGPILVSRRTGPSSTYNGRSCMFEVRGSFHIYVGHLHSIASTFCILQPCDFLSLDLQFAHLNVAQLQPACVQNSKSRNDLFNFLRRAMGKKGLRPFVINDGESLM